eukprot:jgi/Botrbrau1/14654/Bobra.0108s0015.1
MSAGGAFGGARGYQPKPPEKGVFPLDHFGECKAVKQEYLDCLKGAKGRAEACRDLAKKYLECRMDRNLMAKQDLAELGFKQEEPPAEGQVAEGQGNLSQEPETEERRKKGFIAGIRR